MSDDPRRSTLPDDIKQLVLDGRRLEATGELAKRRGITFADARLRIWRWLDERKRDDRPKAGNTPPS